MFDPKSVEWTQKRFGQDAIVTAVLSALLQKYGLKAGEYSVFPHNSFVVVTIVSDSPDPGILHKLALRAMLEPVGISIDMMHGIYRHNAISLSKLIDGENVTYILHLTASYNPKHFTYIEGWRDVITPVPKEKMR